jgi:predicted lipid-binding transport protein (Tim44 family)
MQEIIDQIAARLGIDQAVADKSVAMIVNFIVTQVPADYAEMIKQNVPGFEELATVGAAQAEAADAAAGGGGLMGALGGLMGGGGLAGALGGLMGGSQGGGMAAAMALLGNLQQQGLDIGQIKEMATSLVGNLRQTAGDEAVDKLLAHIPGAEYLVA